MLVGGTSQAHGQILTGVTVSNHADVYNQAFLVDPSGNQDNGLDNTQHLTGAQNQNLALTQGVDTLTNWPAGVTSTSTFLSNASVTNSFTNGTTADYISSQSSGGSLTSTLLPTDLGANSLLFERAAGYTVTSLQFTVTESVELSLSATFFNQDSDLSLIQNSTVLYSQSGGVGTNTYTEGLALGPGTYTLESYAESPVELLYSDPATDQPFGSRAHSNSLTFDAQFQAVPEPAIFLPGLAALTGLTLLRRKR
jgi:hypothetical protein